MKFVQKNKMELGDTLIPDLFILNNMNTLNEIDLKLYIYMLFLSKISKEADKSELAKKLNVTEQDITFSIERLQGEDLIVKTSSGYNIVDLKDAEINKSYIPKVESRRSKSQTEKERKRIAAASAINESYFQGVMSLSWYTDIGSMFENYSFDEEVMIALFHHCQEQKSLNKNYVHAVAGNWFKGGVKTFEDLEEYMENYTVVQKIKQKIKKSLRLNRNFTKYEEQYIDTWIKEYNYDFSVIEEALKLTVSKPNPTLNYVNGILSNWHKKGFKTVKDIEEGEKNQSNTRKNQYISKVQANKSKYQNYEQRNYEDLESFYDNM